MSDVLYTPNFNYLTRSPIAGFEWIDEDTARERYASRTFLFVVDAADRVDDVPRPRWVLACGGGGVRATFFDDLGSVVHEIDWKPVEDRLCRWLTVDYTYPDATRRYAAEECVSSVEALMFPDGSGDITVVRREGSRPVKEVTEFADGRLDSYWSDRPDFGAWSALAEAGPSAYEVAGRGLAAQAS